METTVYKNDNHILSGIKGYKINIFYDIIERCLLYEHFGS